MRDIDCLYKNHFRFSCWHTPCMPNVGFKQALSVNSPQKADVTCSKSLTESALVKRIAELSSEIRVWRNAFDSLVSSIAA